METLNFILPQLSVQDWAVSLVLKDAYLHVPIHQQSRRLLDFFFSVPDLPLIGLPFGLKDSPWVFTYIVATVIGLLRLQGIRIFYYLDDWLLVTISRSLLESLLARPVQTQDCEPSFCVPGFDFPRVGSRSSLAQIPGPSRQLCRSGADLQAPHEASSAAFSSVFQSSSGSPFLFDPPLVRDQGPLPCLVPSSALSGEVSLPT